VIGEVASVRGRVQDPKANPVAGFQVALCDARGRPQHWITTDGDGRFEFDAQLPGRWWIAFAAEVDPSESEPVGEPVELQAGQVAEIVRTTELQRGSIRGMVSAEGGPVDDAWVVAGRGSIDSLVHEWEVGPVLCDLDGNFTLDSLGEGTWAIRAFRRQGGEASAANVELGATVELELAETASIAGQVLHEDGSVPAHFEIQATSGDRRREHSYYRSEGVFELAKLQAGSWKLMVVAESGSELVITPRDWNNRTYSMQSLVLDVTPRPLVQEVGDLPLAGGKLEPGQSPGELGFDFQIVGFGLGLEHVDERHVQVTKIVANGPAAAAGLQMGDVITSIDGASVEGRRASSMGIYMHTLAAGEEIVIERRDASKLTMVATAASEK
jgi:hypothetical protein